MKFKQYYYINCSIICLIHFHYTEGGNMYFINNQYQRYRTGNGKKVI